MFPISDQITAIFGRFGFFPIFLLDAFISRNFECLEFQISFLFSTKRKTLLLTYLCVWQGLGPVVHNGEQLHHCAGANEARRLRFAMGLPHRLKDLFQASVDSDLGRRGEHSQAVAWQQPDNLTNIGPCRELTPGAVEACPLLATFSHQHTCVKNIMLGRFQKNRVFYYLVLVRQD